MINRRLDDGKTGEIGYKRIVCPTMTKSFRKRMHAYYKKQKTNVKSQTNFFFLCKLSALATSQRCNGERQRKGKDVLSFLILAEENSSQIRILRSGKLVSDKRILRSGRLVSDKRVLWSGDIVSDNKVLRSGDIVSDNRVLRSGDIVSDNRVLRSGKLVSDKRVLL